MTFKELIRQSLRLRDRFEKIEQRKWGAEANIIELTKQLGELAKHIMVQEHYYFKARETQPKYHTDKQKIADELADIIWMSIRLADHYEIDLEEAMKRMFNDANGFLDKTEDNHHN